jgi:hypothetical protein
MRIASSGLFQRKPGGGQDEMETVQRLKYQPLIDLEFSTPARYIVLQSSQFIEINTRNPRLPDYLQDFISCPHTWLDHLTLRQSWPQTLPPKMNLHPWFSSIRFL